MKTEEPTLFPLFEELDRTAAEKSAADVRESRIQRHVDSIRCCWPDWEGPAVFTSEDDPSGFCEISAVCAYSLTHGDTRYSYCVPCRILEISEDGHTFIVETAYTNPACHCYPLNGQRWRLDITEIWPPTKRLWKLRDAAEKEVTS